MGLLDYIVNATAGGQRTPEEVQAALYAKRAYTDAAPSRGEATPADLMRVMANMKKTETSPVGNLSDQEALRLMEARRKAAYAGNPLGNLSEAEAARLSQLNMQIQMDELSRQNAFMSNPKAAQYYQQTNPLGNTTANIAPQSGGINVRNPKAPMDLNTLLRMLGR